MSEFFSGVATPKGLFWCEEWSHSETRKRLGNPVYAVDVEYDELRGFEVHEQFRLPDWFAVSAVATSCKQLYSQLLPLVKEYNERRAALYKEYQQRKATLDNDYYERWAALEDEYNERRDALYKEYNERRGALNNEINERWATLNKDHYERRAALVNEFRTRWSTIEGYVPVREGRVEKNEQ